MYGLKLVITGETYDTNPQGKTRDKVCTVIATIYAIWLCYAAGLKYLLLCFILYAVGIIFYYVAKKENNKDGKVIAVIILVVAVIAVIMLATGKVTI